MFLMVSYKQVTYLIVTLTQEGSQRYYDAGSSSEI